MSTTTPAIIARCGVCGHITYAAVNTWRGAYPADVAAEIANMVAAGCNIEHCTVGDVQRGEFCMGHEAQRRPRRKRRVPA